MIPIFIYQEVSLGRTAVQTCRVRCDKKTVSNLYQTGLLWGSQLRRGPAGPHEHPARGGRGGKGEPKGSTRAEDSPKGSASPYPRQTNVWRGRLIWRGLGGTITEGSPWPLHKIAAHSGQVSLPFAKGIQTRPMKNTGRVFFYPSFSAASSAASSHSSYRPSSACWAER